MTYPHSGVQSTRNLIVLLQAWTASQDLRQPELTDCALHVPNLALHRCRCFDPLRRLPAHTTDHVRVRESLWRPLVGFGRQLRGNRLRDTRMEGGGAAGDHE